MSRQKLKLYAFAAILSGLLVEGIILKLLLPFSAGLHKKLIAKSLLFWGSLINLVLGMKVTIKGEIPKTTSLGKLSVSNHPSYLDFFVIGPTLGICYVSPMDLTAESKFFDKFVKAIGCIMVNRQSRDNQGKETQEIKETLAYGVDVHFFPEAKTTDGSEILRFRRPLFAPALDLNCPVQMVTINYQSVDGVALDQSNKDLIHWYRQNRIDSHFWRVLTARDIRVEITVEVKTLAELQSMGLEHIADAAHSVVLKNYRFYPEALHATH